MADPKAGPFNPALIKQGYTAKRLRPFLRRRFNIARPDAVLIRLRKPCLLRRFLLLG